MVSLGVIVALSLIVCTYTAPESSVPTERVSESSSETHQTKPVEGGVSLQDILADDDEPAEKSSGVSTTVKKGELDRGLVSDVIESTLSGMQIGFAIGSNNGTLDRLCIKLGNITMAGCRRTASQEKKASSEDPKMEIAGKH